MTTLRQPEDSARVGNTARLHWDFMAVLRNHQAFQLGYLPVLCGFIYNGLAVVENARRQPHLGERAAHKAQLLRSPDPPPDPGAGMPVTPLLAAMAQIDQVEELLQEVGLKVPARPADLLDLSGYTEWAQRVQGEARVALGEGTQPAYNLGALLGDQVLTLHLLVLVHELRPRPDEEPPWLSAQRRGLVADLERGRVRLALLRGPQGGLPSAVTEEAGRCLRHLDADVTTALGAGNALRGLLQRVTAILAAFQTQRSRKS